MQHRRIDQAPIHASSAIAGLVFDWLAFGLNLSLPLHLFLAVAAGCGLAAGIVVALLEAYLGGVGAREAAVKGLIAAVVITVPLPMLGTVLATLCLSWRLVVAGPRRQAPQRA